MNNEDIVKHLSVKIARKNNINIIDNNKTSYMFFGKKRTSF